MPARARPMPIGQVTGAQVILSTRSISSSSSVGSRPSRSSLLMNVMIGVSRSRQTSISLIVRCFDAFRAVDDHERRVDCGQRAVGVFGEVLVARRVQQVDHAACVRELHDARGHGDSALLFERHPVGRRVAGGLAALDGPGQLDRTPEQQQLFGEGGLAGVGVRNDGEGAATRHFVERLSHPPDFTGNESLRTNASSRPTSAW